MTKIAAELADSLALSPDWRQIFADVPRHLFAPVQAWALRDGRPGQRIDATADRQEWLRHVYAPDTAIIIQCDDGATAASDQQGVPTSSISAPDVAATFLQLLEVRDGNTVLEIGTGSGWTAGLLARRLGSDHVTTVEIDPALAAQAAANLRSAGFDPAVITRDGAAGFPPSAPYDRIHVTCGVSDIPAAWLSQCRPGGIIALPWLPTGHAGHQLKLRVGRDGTATGRFHGSCGYMMMRSQRTCWQGHDVPGARESRTKIDPREIALADPGLHLMIAARMPGVTHFPVQDPDGTFSLLLTDNAPEQSWAAADFYPHPREVKVTEYGHRSLWSEAEAAYAAWLRAGCPVQARFGLTVSHRIADLWLDKPTDGTIGSASLATASAKSTGLDQ